MDDLIALLERTKEPDRKLDAEIAVATFHEPHDSEDLIYATPTTKEDHCEPGTFWRKSRSGFSLRAAPRFTESVDAALTLIPEGWHLVQLRHMNPTTWFAEIGDKIDDRDTEESEGVNGALALCGAALRARLAATNRPPPVPENDLVF